MGLGGQLNDEELSGMSIKISDCDTAGIAQALANHHDFSRQEKHLKRPPMILGYSSPGPVFLYRNPKCLRGNLPGRVTLTYARIR